MFFVSVCRAISLVPTLLPRSVVGIWGAGDTRPLSLFLAVLLSKRRSSGINIVDQKDSKSVIITVRCGEKGAISEANSLVKKHLNSHILLLLDTSKAPARSFDSLLLSSAQFIIVAMQNLMEPYTVLPELRADRPFVSILHMFIRFPSISYFQNHLIRNEGIKRCIIPLFRSYLLLTLNLARPTFLKLCPNHPISLHRERVKV